MMHLSESAVRKQLVDKALSAAGWRVVNYARWQSGHRTAAAAVQEFPTDSGPGECCSWWIGARSRRRRWEHWRSGESCEEQRE